MSVSDIMSNDVMAEIYFMCWDTYMWTDGKHLKATQSDYRNAPSQT